MKRAFIKAEDAILVFAWALSLQCDSLVVNPLANVKVIFISKFHGVEVSFELILIF